MKKKRKPRMITLCKFITIDMLSEKLKNKAKKKSKKVTLYDI